jgi:uncharacterized membrane protein YvbJ
LKKCPGCGSLASDYSVTCGLCGRNLRDVASYQGSVGDAAQEARIEQETSEGRLRKSEYNKRLRRWLSGVSVGVVLIIVGFLTVEFSNDQLLIAYVGYILVLLGFLIAVRAFFGLKGGLWGLSYGRR